MMDRVEKGNPMMMKLPEAGDVIDGTYEIRDVLGTGGFGAVYLARQINMDRDVALKLLVASGAKFEEMVKRFRREVMAIRNLTHPNTIRVYDFRDNPEGLLYYTMEALKGRTLKEEVGIGGPMSPRRLRHVVRQVLKSLSEAHSHGLVHRDLKPANIMIVDMHGETDFVKVLDFGIAKLMADGGDENDPNADQLTSAGILVGTLRYMAPEQISAEYLGPETDLYALGLIAVEMLSGQSIFSGTGRWDVLRQQISDEPVPMSPAVKECGLGPVIMKCLEKRYQQRYSSADEVLRALDQINEGSLSEDPIFVSDGKGGWAPPASGGNGGHRAGKGQGGFEGADTIVVDISEQFPTPEGAEGDKTMVTAAPTHEEVAAARGQQQTVPSGGGNLHSAHTMELAKNPPLVGGKDFTESVAAPSEQGGKKKGLILALILLALVVGAIAGVVVLQSGETEGEVGPEVAVAVDSPASGAMVAPEEPREVALQDREQEEVDQGVGEEAAVPKVREVEVRTGSVRASVLVDGRARGRTPYQFSVEEEGLEIRLEASGYEPLEVRLDLDSPARVELEMSPVERAAEPARAPVEERRVERPARPQQERAPSQEERSRSGSGWVDVDAPAQEPRRSGGDWVDIPAPSEPKAEEEEIPLF